MRVGVYVDGFNLYYGARGLCGKGTPGWRWLNLRGLAARLIDQHSGWGTELALRVTYCTARIKGSGADRGRQNQEIYLRALTHGGFVDHVEFGKYVERIARTPLALEDSKGRPVLVRPEWPIRIQDSLKSHVDDALFMASVIRREEKGSDVNVAAHLLLDVLQNRVDAAVVVSNDSDLRLAIKEVRQRVSTGLVNPTSKPVAGDLRINECEGSGLHWQAALSAEDLYHSQMPPTVGRIHRPHHW